MCADLAVDHLARARRGRSAPSARQRQGHRVADRRERVAQLVGEHREELVLAAVGLVALASARLRSVMSRAIFDAPMIRPGRRGRARS